MIKEYKITIPAIPERESVAYDYICDLCGKVSKKDNLRKCQFCGRHTCPTHTVDKWEDDIGYGVGGDYPEGYMCSDCWIIYKEYWPKFKELEKEYDLKVKKLQKIRLEEMLKKAQS
jgi:hypothetical protein